jgi:hypothetical protein
VPRWRISQNDSRKLLPKEMPDAEPSQHYAGRE